MDIYNQLLFLAKGNFLRLDYALRFCLTEKYVKKDYNNISSENMKRIVEYIKIANFVSENEEELKNEKDVRELTLDIINGRHNK